MAQNSGKQVIEIKQLTFNFDNKPIVNGLDAMVIRGDKIGIIGENGCGKSTLINLLLGKLEPQSGQIKLGTNLEIAYFDQHRAQLDESLAVAESVLEESDYVEINGQRKHVIGYLGDFLFSPDRARQPVSALSGGERNRLLLARVFAKPSNLLILDEPTNDLDVETLELLEELLMNYQGTVLIVSHDREFLNNVCTSCFVFDAPGQVNEYVGGYDDWLRQRPEHYEQTSKSISSSKQKTTQTTVKEDGKSKSKPGVSEAPKKKKLSYKDQREYDLLPEKLEQLEQEIDHLNTEISGADFYTQDSEKVQATLQRLQDKETELEHAFERWEALEALIS
jgi:ATP-binding cassette subfamily F protein uup